MRIQFIVLIIIYIFIKIWGDHMSYKKAYQFDIYVKEIFKDGSTYAFIYNQKDNWMSILYDLIVKKACRPQCEFYYFIFELFDKGAVYFNRFRDMDTRFEIKMSLRRSNWCFKLASIDDFRFLFDEVTDFLELKNHI